MCITPEAIDGSEDEVCCCRGSHGHFGVFGTSNQNPASKAGESEFPPISSQKETDPTNQEESRGVGRPRHEKLSVEAGRRRAGLIAKIPKGYICEWARLEYAGGGIEPIIGCDGNTAEALHHGPDKSTINNEVGINLHRICHNCHNRWHELNDSAYGERPVDNSTYEPVGDFLQHNRLDQVKRDVIVKSERWWSTPKADRKVVYREWTEPRTRESTDKSLAST
jgi:hypothetical protein